MWLQSCTPKAGRGAFTSRFFGEGGKVAQNGRKEDVREGEEMV